MTAQIIPLRRPHKAGQIDLELLEATLRATFPEKISEHAARHSLVMLAKEGLAVEGVVLKGHKSLVDALLRYKVEAIKSELALEDDRIDSFMRGKQTGRPSRYSPLYDLLIFSYCHMVFHIAKARQPLSMRQARQRTADNFNPAISGRRARPRLSIEQIRRAHERTVARFIALERIFGFVGIRGTAYDSALAAISWHIAQTTSDVPAKLRAASESEAAKLPALCRLLALADYRDREQRGRRGLR